MDFPICSECRKSCNEVRRNFGYGRTEYWGAVRTTMIGNLSLSAVKEI